MAKWVKVEFEVKDDNVHYMQLMSHVEKFLLSEFGDYGDTSRANRLVNLKMWMYNNQNNDWQIAYDNPAPRLAGNEQY